MKVLGHPLHPLMIHFPVALLPMDFVMALFYYWTLDNSFGITGFYCLIGGVLIGLVAIITGVLDLFFIPKTNKEAMITGIYHGFINGTVIFVFAIFAYNSWQSYPSIAVPTTIEMLIKGFLIMTLFAGNYMGGKLIYKHHIGLKL